MTWAKSVPEVESVAGQLQGPGGLLAGEAASWPCVTRPLALVTGTDAGAVEGEGVTHAEALKVFAANVTRMR
jgi:5'-methylthioadenosine phosphorylase